MLLQLLQLVPPSWPLIVGVLVVLAVLRAAIFQGRATTRDRDLHNRTILLTGAFSSLGLALLTTLARRGAKIIALDPQPVPLIVDALRSTSNNEHIYAEQCNLAKPADIHAFCTQFLTRDETRLDALVFAHEYEHIGALIGSSDGDDERDARALATFLLTTLLLPALLVAPVERDIRIINVVNPFYAAAAAIKPFNPSFHPTSTKKKSIFLSEGLRSLRTIILTRHLQRILDSLPKPQVPKAEDGSSSVPVTSHKLQKSNIVAVSVSPGISRLDTVSKLMNADWSLSGTSFSWLGVLVYMLFSPLFYLTTKSPKSSIQSILHALFLPTPFKVLSTSNPNDNPTKSELLKPGALYANCATIKLDVSIPKDDDDTKEDDGEYGGEAAGRAVWEAYEAALKIWDDKKSE